jgi:serine/threonine-protein kinase
VSDPERRRRVDDLCDAALSRDPLERAEFVAAACGGDEALRQEVEALLAHAPAAEGFLRSSIGAVAAKVLGDERAVPLTGRRISDYQILTPLGAGGMGEVYRARDTKLGREVAIKILPRAFTSDPDRLARFEREARVLAALNHPHIGAIYGVVESDDIQALVLELVEGPTLADRLAKGPVTVAEAVGIARQIADALEAAHEKGIVHRDLKPANIKITPDGNVKVLDFGLAKAAAGDAASGADFSRSPTVTVGGTREGAILGTAAYMSPEQSRGRPVDKRSDIWAFGCVLYELLTGRQAFAQETISDTIAAVLDREPDWTALPTSVPTSVSALLRRCLQKDSHRRLHDVADARIELEETLGAHVSADRARPSQPATLKWVVGFLLLAVTVGAAIWSLRPSPATAPSSRIASILPSGQLLAGLEVGSALALSPDGGRLAYVARQDGVQRLYLRQLSGLDAQPVPGSEGAVEPFFSPDGRWVAFFAGGKLRKASVSSGESLILADATDPRGGSWGSKGNIVFAPTRRTVFEAVLDTGGSPQTVTRVGEEENAHRWPEFLPSGEAVLFAAAGTGRDWNSAQIAVQSLRTGERRNLLQGGTHPRYAASGHLIYASGGNLMAAPFDPDRLEVTGTPVAVVEGVVQSALTGAAQYSISATGSLIYVPASVQATERRLVWVSRNGTEEPTTAPPHGYRQPRISPDGRRIAVAIEEKDTQVWLYDFARDTLTRLSFEGEVNYNPIWSPDGNRVAFQSTGRGTIGGLFSLPADGSGRVERIGEAGSSGSGGAGCGGNPGSWTPDGQVLACTVVGDPKTNMDITLLKRGDTQLQRFLQTPFNEGAPVFSPDGHWLAYASDESSRYEIYVSAYPGPGGKYQISNGGGTEPAWNRSGRELLYRSGDRMMAVDVQVQPTFSVGMARVLFQGQYEPNPTMNANYDVSPDGQRFLMLKPASAQEAAPTQINVVLNWDQELKRLVPTR